jgi:phenylacetate-CoA ligase
MRSFKSKIIEHLILRMGDFLLGSHLFKQLNIQRGYTNFSEDELKNLQLQKLNNILIHATTTTDFYKQFLSQTHDPVKWLKEFPIINKKHTNQFTKELRSSIFTDGKLIKYETSGSSGIRSVVYIDKKEQSTFRAILLNWWEWNGYNLGNPILQTGI